MKEGFKSDYQIATDPKTRSGYWWKTAKIDLLPKMLMAAAFAGLLGDALKDFYEKSRNTTRPITSSSRWAGMTPKRVNTTD